MDKFVHEIIEHRFRSVWKTYTGTTKALREHERLRSWLQKMMNDNSLMTLGERTEADTYLKSHDGFADQMRKELQRLDDGNTPRVPSFYNYGELLFLEQWKQEFVNDKDRAVAGLDRDKDLSPYVNHIL